jgi:tetratricopeptide (TPR) repeat protein
MTTAHQNADIARNVSAQSCAVAISKLNNAGIDCYEGDSRINAAHHYQTAMSVLAQFSEAVSNGEKEVRFFMGPEEDAGMPSNVDAFFSGPVKYDGRLLKERKSANSTLLRALTLTEPRQNEERAWLTIATKTVLHNISLLFFVEGKLQKAGRLLYLALNSSDEGKWSCAPTEDCDVTEISKLETIKRTALIDASSLGVMGLCIVYHAQETPRTNKCRGGSAPGTFSQNSLEEAMHYFSQGIRTAQGTIDPPRALLGDMLNISGHLLMSADYFEEASEAFEEANALNLEIKCKIHLTVFESCTGRIFNPNAAAAA